MSELISKYVNASTILINLNACIDCCYERDEWRFSIEWNNCARKFDFIAKEISANPEIFVEKIQSLGIKIKNNISDYVVCSSVIQNEIIPLVSEELNKCDVEIRCFNDYELIKAQTGVFSLMYKTTGKFCHSIIDPIKEAMHQAEFLFNADSEDIVILGVGLGYLSYLLWEKSCKSTNVYIFEKKSECIDIAMKYGFLNKIDEKNLNIIVLENEDDLVYRLNELSIDLDNAMCSVSDWFMDSIDEPAIYDIFKSFGENVMTQRRFFVKSQINSRRNHKKVIGDISILEEKIVKPGKEFIVVAPGPSLDDSMDYVKACIDKKVIIAVDAAMRRLINHGVMPDYVVTLDPNEAVMRYLDGIEEVTQDITLIACEKAYWKFVNDFRGNTYCIDENQEAESTDIHYAVTNCTTVSSLAILVALHFGAQAIDLAGLDLSYPGGKIYAGNVKYESNVKADMITRSVQGEPVETSEIFLQFKKEIEEIIRINKNITFTNLSKKGAYIQGAFMSKWWEDETLKNVDYIQKLTDDKMLEWDEKYYLMWQRIGKYICEKNSNPQSIESDSQFWEEVASLLSDLTEEFIRKADIEFYHKIHNDKFVVLLTSLFSAASDEISDKIREDAYNLKCKYGFEVLIVNTGEYMGGKKVALKSFIDGEENDDFNKDAIFYMGERIPYFEFGKGMPDLEQIKYFISTISENTPISFIAYDTLSIVASACKLIGNVEYR